jgi:HAD superfamily hydrolase (TIGR01459 family)
MGRAEQNLWEGTAFYSVDTLEDASFIVLTGVDHGTDFSEKYTQILSRARELNLPMVCANPDQFVNINGQRIWCAGRLGSIYAQGGGAVFWHGKPIGLFFKKVMARASPIPASRMLMIGDGINTDIRGACYAGIDSLFLPSGMFGPQLGVKRQTPWDEMEDVHAWVARYPFHPTYVAPSLALWQL